MKFRPRRLFWICKGPVGDPETYGINKPNVSAQNNSVKRSNSSTDDSSIGEHPRALVAGVAGAGVSAAALSSASMKKVEAIEEKAVEKIHKTDEKAMKEVAAVYRAQGVEMQKREPAKNTSALALGAVAGSVAVVGAGGAALAAGLSSDNVDKIMTIEGQATQDIDSIADKANDDVAKVYKKEGVERPTTSGMTAAALSSASLKKVEAIEERAVEKIHKTDEKAMKEVAGVYRAQGVKMQEREPAKNTSALPLGAVAGSVAIVGAGGAAVVAGLSSDNVDKIITIEGRATQDIDTIADKANEDVAKVYKKEGVKRPTTSGMTAAALSPASLKKVEAIEERAVEKIHKTDEKAMKEVAGVYRAQGVKMQKPEPASNTSALALGAVAGSVAVVGAGGAALAAGLSSDNVDKIKTIEGRATQDIDSIADKANEDVAKVYKKEGVEGPTTSGMAATTAAAAAGLSVAAQRNVGAVADRSAKRIETIDEQAVEDIDSIFCENGMTMEKPSPTQTNVGNLTPTVAVAGATTAAVAAKMGSLDIARVQNIESSATEQIKSIDRQTGDDIAEIYESEGKWYDKPGGSRAAAAAVSAGLGLAAVKEIASVEEHAEREIESIDNAGANGVIEADKVHAAQMYKNFKQGMSEDSIEVEEKTAANKYATVESKATARIARSDASAGDKITEIYIKEDKALEESNGPFTARGAAGATATAAAIAAAARGAENRKLMFADHTEDRSALKEESPGALASIGNASHLALYDVGAGVAWAGKSLTGGYVDFEGPAEYDARADYTPEQKAQSSCCAAY